MRSKFRFSLPLWSLSAAVVMVVGGSSLQGATGTWTVDANGNWSTTTNWTSGTVADGSTFIANFTNNITADRTINLDTARTINSIVFSDSTPATAGSWTLSGSNTLTLGGTTPTITVGALGTSKTATISTVIAGTAGLTKAGVGTLVLGGTNTYSGNTTVNEGIISVTGNVSGATGGWLLLGTGGSGVNTNATTVSFQTGSSVSVASGNSIQLGNTTGSGGTNSQTLNAAGTVANAGSLFVGRAGVLNINSGAAWTQSGTSTIASQGGYAAAMNVASGGSFTYTGTGAFNIVSSGSIGVSTNLNITGGTFTTGRAFQNTNSSVISGTSSNVVLNNGGTLRLSANIADLASTSGGTFNFQVGATGSGGIINTNGFDATLDTTIVNVTSQAGKLTKSGAGTLTLTVANSYSGGTTLGNNSGTLAITNGSALGSGTISLSKGSTDASALQLSNGITVANAINFASANSFSNGGTGHIVNASGNNILSGLLTLTGTGGNGISLQSDSGLLTVTGNIASSVADSNRTHSFGGAGNGIVTGVISNNSSTNKVSVDKAGAGTWTFSGANTYSSGTSIQNGTVLIGVSNVGSTSGALGIASVALGSSATGASLLTNGAYTFSNAINVTANPTAGANTLGGNADATSTFSGIITLSGNVSITQVATSGSNALNITGGIRSGSAGTQTVTFAGTGAINVSGGALANNTGTLAVAVSGGDVNFSGTNTYTGGTSLSGGMLTVGSTGAIGTSGTVSFDGGTLRHSAANTTDYSSRFSTNAGQAYKVDTDGQDVIWGTALTSSGGSLTKSGSGRLSLSGINTYSGATTVNGGTLLVSGRLDNTSGVNVASGAVLGGTGTIHALSVTTVSGTLAPGASIGTLTVGSVAFNDGSTFSYELNSAALGGDVLNVAGDLAMTGAVTLSLVELASGALSNGDKLTLISYDGDWNNNTFDGYGNGEIFTLGANDWMINYADTTAGANGGLFANYVTLTVVPEPGSALLGGLGLLLLLRRRR